MHLSRYFDARRERMRQAAFTRWLRHRERLAAAIAAGEIEPREPDRRNQGEFLGTLQWHGADGVVRRWHVRQGQARNRIAIDGVPGDRGWTWLLDRLRRKLRVF